MSMAASLDHFPQFLRLPQELQDIVWNIALDDSEDRAIFICGPGCDVTTRDKVRGLHLCGTCCHRTMGYKLRMIPSGVPPLLHACRVSRTIALSTYHLITREFTPNTANGHVTGFHLRIDKSVFSKEKIYMSTVKDVLILLTDAETWQNDFESICHSIEGVDANSLNYGWTIYRPRIDIDRWGRRRNVSSWPDWYHRAQILGRSKIWPVFLYTSTGGLLKRRPQKTFVLVAPTGWEVQAYRTVDEEVVPKCYETIPAEERPVDYEAFKKTFRVKFVRGL